MSHSIPTSHVLSICNLDCSMLFTKWRHHIGTTSEKNNSTKACYFHCARGYTHECTHHLSPGDPPTSASPSANPSPISVQSPWPERQNMSVTGWSVWSGMAARFLSKSQVCKQWLSSRRKKLHMRFKLSGYPWLSSPHITACHVSKLREQATQHLQLIAPVHNSKGKRKNNWEQAAFFCLFPTTLLPLAPAQTAMCQHLVLSPVAVSGVAGATATDHTK